MDIATKSILHLFLLIEVNINIHKSRMHQKHNNEIYSKEDRHLLFLCCLFKICQILF